MTDDVAAFIAFFVGFCVFLYAIRWVPLPLSTTGHAAVLQRRLA